jgi:hypothetical protein
MWVVIAFCLALPPVLLLGTLCIELLLWDAPRRGKRPDVKSRDTSHPGRYVRVVTAGGMAVRGTPEQVVHALIRSDFDAPLPFPLTHTRAERLLENWAEAGRLSVQGEW